MAFWHSLFGRARHSSVKAHQPHSTTPIADAKLRLLSFGGLARFVFVLGVPLALLLIYGQPALRIKYHWNGNIHAPVYSQCEYLTLLDGWRDVRPQFGVNNCPLIGFFPFEFSMITGD